MVTVCARAGALFALVILWACTDGSTSHMRPEVAEGADAVRQGEDDRNAAPAAEGDLCRALDENDRLALKSIVDRFLSSLEAAEPTDAKLEKIRRWVEEQPCVASAYLGDELETEPAIQQIAAVMDETSEPPKLRTIGILLAPDRLRFNY